MQCTGDYVLNTCTKLIEITRQYLTYIFSIVRTNMGRAQWRLWH